MRSKKNAVALLALLVMALSAALTGCGGGEGGDSQPTATLDKEHMFKSEFLKLEHKMSYISGKIPVSGNNLYVTGQLEEPVDGMEGMALLQIDLETMEETLLSLPVHENGYPQAMTVSPDGMICYVESVYSWDEKNPENSKSQFFFRAVTPEMEEVSNIELTEMGENFYPNTILVDEKGNFFVSDYQTLWVFDKDGKKLSEEAANSITSMFINGKGEVMISAYDEGYTNVELKVFDLAANSMKVLKSWPVYASTFQFVNGDESYPIYMSDGTELFGYNPDTDEQTLILNWVNCDVNGSNLNEFNVVNKEKVLCSAYNELSSKQEVMVLTKLDPSEVKDKKILTLASVYDDYSMKGAVIAFNRQSDECRIVMKDYSEYITEENYNAGAEKFNNDLISGVVPDIINLQQLNVNNYVSKGLLEDLYPLMEQDPDIDKKDYLENVFAALENDGKLYELVPSFYVYTVIGKEENVGAQPGWTIEDMEAILEKMPEGAKAFKEMSREEALEYGHYLAAKQFVDYKAGTCSYDTGEFKKLLEFASKFPSREELYGDQNGGYTVVSDDYMKESEDANLYKKNKVLLEMMFLYTYGQIHTTKYSDFGGEELTFIGFPTENKNGSAIMPQVELAISSTSANKEGAWEFVKFFLSDDYQASISFGFPIKADQLDRMKEEAQKPQTYLDEKGKEVEVENTMVIEGKTVNIGQISDADAKKLNDFLSSLDQVLRVDAKIQKIIEEETKAYFEGQKSAEEVAKLVQNRVQTYLSESK